MSDSLWSHGLQYARPPCPSPTPRACSYSCPLSRWCHPTISSSVIPFSSCFHSFPALGSFLVSQFFTSSGQSIVVSVPTSVLPINIQDWFPLWLTGFIFLAIQEILKDLLQHHRSKASILRHSTFFMVQLSHPYMTTGKTIALTRWTFVGKVMSLLFNMLSSLVIALLPGSMCLLISWLQSLSAVTLEPKKKVCHFFHCFSIYLPWIHRTRCHDLCFWMLSIKPAFSLSSFTFIRRPFSSSLFSSMRVVSSAYLRVLIFLLIVVIPPCASFILAFHMMYSSYKLNKQDDNKHPWSTPFPIWNQSIVPCVILTIASLPAYRFLREQVGWSGIPISLRIQLVVIHAVKGFGIVNKAKVDVQTTAQLLISHASIWARMLKILEARLQQFVNLEHPDVWAGFRKGRGTRDQIVNIYWIIETAREFQ